MSHTVHNTFIPQTSSFPEQTKPTTDSVVTKSYICGQCGRPARAKCGGCRQIYYCNKKCQILAWQIHATVCADFKQDKQGLTSLHHAVLTGKEDQLSKEQKELLNVVRDSFNGTPADLMALMDEPNDNGPLSLSIKKKGKVTPLTQQQFVELTGVKFKENFVVTADNIKDWHVSRGRLLNKEQAKRALMPQDPRVQRFANRQPLLFLIDKLPLGIGLQAGESIAEGELICLKGGELQASASLRVAGLGALIPDGPPNCRITYLKHYKGLPYCAVIEAIRPIGKRENLYLNYGPEKYLKPRPYVIRDESYQEVVQFCQTNFYRNVNDTDTTICQNELFDYIWTTPSLFILLHLRNVLKVTQTKELLQNGFVRLKFSHLPIFNYYDKILSCIAMVQQNKEIISVIEFAQTKLSDTAFMQMLLVMEGTSCSIDILHYQTFGMVFDQVIPVHKNQKLDFSSILTKYALLPDQLKKIFKNNISILIEDNKHESLSLLYEKLN